MNNDWCCICGEDACDELREGSPVCDFHRSMVDGGYTLDELRAERDAEDDDTQELPDIRKLVNALSTDYPPVLSPIEQAVHWAQNNGGIMPAHTLKAAVLELAAENETLKAELRKQQNVIDALKRARDRYLQRLTDVRAERDALKAALKPFAKIGNDYADFILDETKFRNERDGWLDWFPRNVSMIHLFDACEAAARALKAEDGA